MIQIDRLMPDGCDVCPLMYDYIQCNALPEGCEDDDDFDNDEFDWTNRPGWCPLKEIVRCKDCIHSTVLENGLIKCGHTFRSADFFCADGKKRD